MIRLLFFILFFAVFLGFMIFNLGNKCDVSIGFRTFTDIPVFLTAFFSFALGMLFTIPLVFSRGRKRGKASQPEPANNGAENERKGRFFDFRKKEKPALEQLYGGNTAQGRGDLFTGFTSAGYNENKKENSPYEID
jgi:hypothetical protein